MRLFSSIFILAFTTFYPFSAIASSPYDQELSKLAGEVRSLMIRADRLSSADKSGKVELFEMSYEISKKLHRLEEEADAANIALQQAGKAPDRGLSYAAATADALDLARKLTSAQLVTGDRNFGKSAMEAARLARTIMAYE